MNKKIIIQGIIFLLLLGISVNVFFFDTASSIPNDKETIPQLSFEEGNKTVDNQIQIIMYNLQKWIVYPDNSDIYVYTIADLDQNGRIEIISHTMGGTGFFSDNKIFEVNTDYNGIELCNIVSTENSQADIGYPSYPVYYNIEKNQYAYIVDDISRNGSGEQYFNIRAMILKNGEIKEILLGYQSIIHSIDEFSDEILTNVTTTNAIGDIISQEEYENIAKDFFVSEEKLNAKIKWERIPQELGFQEMYDLLSKCFEGFEITED